MNCMQTCVKKVTVNNMPIISLLADALYALENSKYTVSPICIDKITIDIDTEVVWIYAYNNLYKYNASKHQVKMIDEKAE